LRPLNNTNNNKCPRLEQSFGVVPKRTDGCRRPMLAVEHFGRMDTSQAAEQLEERKTVSGQLDD
jgi:hypothetical protein